MEAITLNLPDELRSLADRVRGDQALTDYLMEAVEQKIYYDLMPRPQTLEELTPGLTAEDHLHLIEEARQPGRTMSVAEVKSAINAKYDRLLGEDNGEDDEEGA